MLLNERIRAFAELGRFLSQFRVSGNQKDDTIPFNSDFFELMTEKISVAKHHNGWFTEENVRFSLSQWSTLLTERKLKEWLRDYDLQPVTPKTVGIIMAGNIPLVGFHDFICVLLTGHRVQIKQSSNDSIILPVLVSYLQAIQSYFKKYIHFDDSFTTVDAIIATGSNNTARYFEYYFSKKPHIIRKNRNSVAILTGKESAEQLASLGEDIFRYYGLGCRSVSKIFVPKDYKFDPFFEAIYEYQDIMNSSKYANNYDYNKTVYLMSNFKLLENGFLLLKEDDSYGSPIATLFYEYYSDENDLQVKIDRDAEKIQCIVADNFQFDTIDFGETQKPSLTDYPDGIDVIQFLSKIN